MINQRSCLTCPCPRPQVTVNNQIVIGTLMNLCDDPNHVRQGGVGRMGGGGIGFEEGRGAEGAKRLSGRWGEI